MLAPLGCADDVSGNNQPPGGGAAICGNKIIEQNETCDDGNTTNGDGCSAKCKIESGPGNSDPYCGNGKIEGEEACDDKNNTNDDGCSSTCAKETGYDCQGEPSQCFDISKCYNGIINGKETCDDGNTSDNDGCSHFCRVEEGFECDVLQTPSRCYKLNACGNGILESKNGELCDDGNTTSNDGCSADCKAIESGYACPTPGKLCYSIRCGDSMVDAQEECDLGDDNLTTTYSANGQGCGADCRFPAYCGDGKVELGIEACDLGKDYNTGAYAGCTQQCELAPHCGDGQLTHAENCEDGNAIGGDGCSASCRVEAGWICPEDTTKPCYAASCGDGLWTGDEECDDGNAVSGDGCSYRCQLEEHYKCEVAGQPCVAITCGDQRVEGLETCDIGFAGATECCNDDCKLTGDYVWENNGCRATVCGDGKIEGPEQCDLGATTHEGCVNCRLTEGWHCPGDASTCVRSQCGNGVIEGLEACDDHNLNAGDGCNPFCEIEAIFACKDNVCKAVCGDGVTLWKAGEECDDGNLISGDGCNSKCEREPGFQCTDYSSELPSAIQLPIVYRDFRFYYYETGTGDGFLKDGDLPAHCSYEIGRGHPDFHQWCVNADVTNAVAETLGKDGKPVFTGNPQMTLLNDNWYPPAQPESIYTCKEAFDMWYHDVPGINRTFPRLLTLDQQGETGTYVFDSQHFFPLSDDPDLLAQSYGVKGNQTAIDPQHGASNQNKNGTFTSEFKTYFEYKGEESMTFRGDDDAWVFINGHLAIDLGGIHPARTATVTLANTINPDTGKKYDARFNLHEGGIYEIAMFHAERCTGSSSYRLTLANFLNTGTTICASQCGDGLVRGAEQCDLGMPITGPEAEAKGCVECQLKPVCGNNRLEFPEQCEPPSAGSCDANCMLPVGQCGNGTLESPEVCDGLSGPQPCLTNCQQSKCGDTYVDTNNNEECDDGNTVDTDMCTGQCQKPKCGDAIVTELLSEVCDDGINNGAYGSCSFDCRFRAPYCGDGIHQSSEEVCDDGNNVNDDGCSDDCTVEPGWECTDVEGEISVCRPIIN